MTQRKNNLTAYQLSPARLRFNSPGKPLPDGVLQKMESIFKTDFSQVRVHTGREAESIGALAFTSANDVYFAPGQFRTNSSYGQRLLGHELTHVVQQKTGKVKNPFTTGFSVINDPGLEAEAERMSQKVILQLRPDPSGNPNSIIQMAPKTIAVDKKNIIVDTSQHNWRMLDSDSGVIFAIVKTASENNSREFWMTTEKALIPGNESDTFQVVPKGEKFSFLEESVRVIVESGNAPDVFQSHFSGSQIEYFRTKYDLHKQTKTDKQAAADAYCDTAFGKAVLRNGFMDIEINIPLDASGKAETVISKAYKGSKKNIVVKFT